MPYIEEHFNVLTGRENTAIAGNSIGCRNLLAIGFKYQDKFGYIGAFSSVSPLPDERYTGRIPALLDEYMTERGIDHVFYDVDGEHENRVWQNCLYNFCKNIFKQEKL